MHNRPDTLSDVIKAAREKADITIEALAEKVGITERYLYRIENEGKKPRNLFERYTRSSYKAENKLKELAKSNGFIEYLKDRGIIF